MGQTNHRRLSSAPVRAAATTRCIGHDAWRHWLLLYRLNYIAAYSYGFFMGADRRYADRLYDYTHTTFYGYTWLGRNASSQ